MPAAPPSARSTTSGSSTATSASKSPSRAAARNASTTSHCASRSASGPGGDSTHASPRTAGELVHSLWRALQDLRDVAERHREHVVQYEREPFRRCQHLEHYQQRQTDRVGDQRLVLGVGAVSGVDHRVGNAHIQWLLAPGLGGAQHVQSHSRDDGREPPAQVLDLAGVGTAEPDPGVLDGVIRLRSESPAFGRRPHAGAAAAARIAWRADAAAATALSLEHDGPAVYNIVSTMSPRPYATGCPSSPMHSAPSIPGMSLRLWLGCLPARSRS
jgi:hypothetical protein